MKRDLSIDSLKGFLIILVILGHLIGSLNAPSVEIWNLIYTFHMPLFVLISGYFSKHDKVSLSTIIKPLIVFQAINVTFLLVLGHRFSISYLLIPYWTLWYLLSLIFWRIILRYSSNYLLNRPYLYLGITIFLSMIVGVIFTHGRILSIQRTFTFLPFFLMGYYFKKDLIKQKIWNNCVSIYLLVILSIIITFVWYPTNSNLLLRGADPYTINDLPAKVFIFGCTLVFIYSLWNLKRGNTYLAKIGKDSLFYYLYHGLIIKFMIVPVVKKTELSITFVSCLFLLFLILMTLHLMNKVKFFRWFVNPTLKIKLI